MCTIQRLGGKKWFFGEKMIRIVLIVCTHFPEENAANIFLSKDTCQLSFHVLNKSYGPEVVNCPECDKLGIPRCSCA